MQALMLPSRPAPAIAAATSPSHPRLILQVFKHTASLSPHYLSRLIPPHHSPLSISPKPPFSSYSLYATPLSTGPAGYPTDEEQSEASKLAQVSKRLENTSRYFKRWGSFGFWGQLLCTLVSAVIISFSTVLTGKVTSPITFYTTAGGIAAAFVSVFWSFGYIRLSERLRRTANDPAKAPPRADVVKSLRNGIFLNIIGMGASLLGMQATVGLLVAKALTSSAAPYYQGIAPGQSPVLGLDVFLVQASANTILSHFFGLVSSLELLRSVTLPNLQAVPIRS